MINPRHISLEIGDPPIRTPIMVSMCESSVSLSYGKNVIHIPWSEISTWIAWFTEENTDE